MSEAFKWNLTPAERRIAEIVFALSRIDYDPLARAYDAVIVVRSLRGDIRDRKVSLMEREKMLAELRSEPETTHAHCPDQFDLGTLRINNRGLTVERDRLRALLEALVACDNVSASVAAIEAIIAAARKELAR